VESHAIFIRLHAADVARADRCASGRPTDGSYRIAQSYLGGNRSVCAGGLSTGSGERNGSIWQWRILCLLQGLCTALIVPTVWIAAVIGRFQASRGLALAFALAGVGLATAVWPFLAATFVRQLGWRAAYLALALSWGVLILPLVLRFFYGPYDGRNADSPRPQRDLRYGQIVRSRAFVCLTLAGGIFASVSFGLTLHMVPILRGNGLGLSAAAGIAGVGGLFSILGRVGTGFLLDNLATRTLGTVVFLLPVAVSMLLRFGGKTQGSQLAVRGIESVGIDSFAAVVGVGANVNQVVLICRSHRRREHRRR